ncbi:bidirectional hydrogenase complex protein HoxU [Anaerolineae bacterium CFX9]|jgi:bidirectional [NiFe] hydrogenase diaphorase subunit|nr:bidirectional hydrogenase complex protein HoxU [Oscillatoria laete-virens]MDK3158222.1 bidirectional hydrogenase complex protein HoxU [Kamptonema cortianum]MDL1900597.1 bidirectional hydrogenase complex protein HoxU [Anaerolineae bacterium CFX9]MDL5055433.1 bidirectional hydrogenase complex protein HoxU [Oscillatoria laete-virens NRMC-F 0139]
MSRVVTFRINDQDVSGREDETILDVARDQNIPVPTLCHVSGLSSIGACRLCLVEVVGIPRLLPACTTFCAEGMEVHTDSERLRKYRRMTVEMLFAEGNHICSVCVENGHCELQDLAVRMGIDHIRMPNMFPRRWVDASHQRFAIDHNRCVLCTRCVRVCDEIEGSHTWDVMGRGVESRVITDMNQPWGESETCTSCGKCVQVCPTGALFEKGRAVGEMTKRYGFLTYLSKMREEQK